MSILSKAKRYTHIVIAVILAGIAGLGVYYYVNTNIPSQKVIVSATRLPVGTTISSEMVKYELYPKSSLPGDVISSPEDVLGKTVTIGVLENSLIREGNLVEGSKGSLSVRLNAMAPGKNAVDLPPETAQGLFGVSIGDLVEIHTETGVVDATGKSVSNRVEKVAKDAVVLSTPYSKNDKASSEQVDNGCFVVAVTPAEEENIADGIVRGKKFSLFLLPPKGGQ